MQGSNAVEEGPKKQQLASEDTKGNFPPAARKERILVVVVSTLGIRREERGGNQEVPLEIVDKFPGRRETLQLRGGQCFWPKVA